MPTYLALLDFCSANQGKAVEDLEAYRPGLAKSYHEWFTVSIFMSSDTILETNETYV